MVRPNRLLSLGPFEQVQSSNAMTRGWPSSRPIHLVVFALLSVFASDCKTVQQEHANQQSAADVILFGGKVYTADPRSPWAQAVAIKNDRIIRVGSSSEVRSLARSETVMIDLGNRVVIPGINDAHDHLGDPPFGIRFRSDQSPTPDPALSAVVDSVRSLVEQQPPGTWLQGLVGMKVLGDGAAARVALDKVAPEHPILLF